MNKTNLNVEIKGFSIFQHAFSILTKYLHTTVSSTHDTNHINGGFFFLSIFNLHGMWLSVKWNECKRNAFDTNWNIMNEKQRGNNKKKVVQITNEAKWTNLNDVALQCLLCWSMTTLFEWNSNTLFNFCYKVWGGFFPHFSGFSAHIVCTMDIVYRTNWIKNNFFASVHGP